MQESRSKWSWRSPVAVPMAVAVFGVLAMLIVDHGPWSRPQVQTAEVATHKTTGEAARAVGATLTPTKAAIEPASPGPKAQPENPVMPWVRSPQRMLTNFPHTAARPAPAKT